MTDLKCIRCGGLTSGATQLCKVCEIELNPLRPSSAGAVYYPSPRWATTSNRDSVTIGPFDSVGSVLGPTLQLFIQNFWLIAKLTVVIAAPFEIFRALSFPDLEYDSQLAGGIFVLDLLCDVLIAPALIYSLLQVMQTGKAPGINEAFRRGFSKLWKLIVCAVISWLLIGVGFMLCFIPGIVIAVALILVFPIAVLENGSVLEVFEGSNQLTKGHRWDIFSAGIVVLLLMGILSVPVELGGEYIAARDAALWPFQAAGGIFAAIMQQSVTVFSLVTYLSIRALWSQSTQ